MSAVEPRGRHFPETVNLQQSMSGSQKWSVYKYRYREASCKFINPNIPFLAMWNLPVLIAPVPAPLQGLPEENITTRPVTDTNKVVTVGIFPHVTRTASNHPALFADLCTLLASLSRIKSGPQQNLPEEVFILYEKERISFDDRVSRQRWGG